MYCHIFFGPQCIYYIRSENVVDSDSGRVEGSCSVDPRHCVLVATTYADVARQYCVGRRTCDGLRVTSRPCPQLRPTDYQLLVFICVPGTTTTTTTTTNTSRSATDRQVAYVSQIDPFRGEIAPPSNTCTWFLGPTRVHVRKGTSIGAAVFARLTNVSNRQTNRQTTLHFPVY